MAKKPLISTLDNNFVDLGKTKDLTNKDFNSWHILGYKGNGYWLCECQCENHTKRIVRRYELVTGGSKSCGCARHEDLTGEVFGNWKVLKYAENQSWLCECQCKDKTLKVVSTQNLKSGSSRSCGCLQKEYAAEHMRKVVQNRTEDITGREFGDYIAIKYVGEGNWLCKCKTCGYEHTFRKRDTLRNISCKKHNHPSNFIDLKKLKIIHNWEILEYVGNKTWRCKCVCGTIKDIKTQRLLSGDSKSCGCMRKTEFLKSYRYTDDTSQLILNKDLMEDALKKLKSEDKNITYYDVSTKLGIKYQLVVRTLQKFDLDSYISKYPKYSHIELEIIDYIKTLCNSKIIHGDRDILNGYEIDIYIPDQKIAIEFNGSYWHSDFLKDKLYHQDKTLKCFRKGIRLIHIFEHEWINNKDNIQKFLRDTLDNNKQRIYARNTNIVEIDKQTKKDFLEEFHLQGNDNSSIQLGCYNGSELVGVITLGKPRFDSSCEYEIFRLCWKNGIIVIGGLEKFISNILKKYKVNNIVTYSDISKFTGMSYIRAGFKMSNVTEPGYVWVSNDMKTVLSRYQTQKHKLLKKNLGEYGDTEDEIMYNLGYMRVYNSGNAKYIFNRENNNG